MKINWKKVSMVVGLAGITAVPFAAMADGFNFKVKVGDDNEAHYRFRSRRAEHDPEMLKAARSLAEAKSHLWYAKNEFGGHRSRAIQQINMALDEINAAEANRGNNRDNRNDDRR